MGGARNASAPNFATISFMEKSRVPWLMLFAILTIFLFRYAYTHPDKLAYRFEERLLTLYRCSQDIPTEPPCKRVFLSDSDIHIAAGILYTRGANPTEYNFQHPPLIKYLYGFGVALFKNPYVAQIALSAVFILATYFLTVVLTSSKNAALLAALLLSLDPLFMAIAAETLLDMGQALWFTLFLIVLLRRPHAWALQGILLGVLFASKFWSLALILTAAAYMFFYPKKRVFGHEIFKAYGVSFVIFCLTYLKTFIDTHGTFNIVWFQLKTLKYWLQHTASGDIAPGSLLVTFLTGLSRTWWGNHAFTFARDFTLFWPLGLILAVYTLYKEKGRLWGNARYLPHVLIAVFFVATFTQAPFTRYFLLILPLIYGIIAAGLWAEVTTRCSFIKALPHRRKKTRTQDSSVV